MAAELIKKRNDCRVCKKKLLTQVFNFGPTPLANEFLSKDQIDGPELFFPLEVYFCTNCSFLQLGHVVDPQVLFGNYVYVSSTSPVFVKHFQDFADDIISRFSLTKESLVIDIGSNDGILLKPYYKKGIRVLGIEPAKHIARMAEKDGIESVAEFFSVVGAKKIVKKKGKAKVVTATNVFAHIDDLDEVINGIKELLDKDGMFIMEAPYLIDFIQKKYFDLVYHEHLSYWAVAPLITIFERFDMKVFDVQKVNAHGGTIRVFVERNDGPYKIDKRVAEKLREEKKMKLKNIKTYSAYAKEVLENRVRLINLLAKLKLQGKKIVGYGAPAKGNTLLNYFGIRTDFLDYIIDDSPLKQGLYAPGTRIPIVSSAQLKKDRPDYILILAWNFAMPIMEKYDWFKKEKGKFVVPVPRPKIV